jgi:hypothetical protein
MIFDRRRGPGMLDRFRETLTVVRFQQIIKCMEFKRFQCKFIIRCNEDDPRERGRTDPFKEFESIHLRHLDVQEDQVGLLLLKGGERLETVRTDVDDIDIRFALREQFHLLAGERFIINDDCADHIGDSSSGD